MSKAKVIAKVKIEDSANVRLKNIGNPELSVSVPYGPVQQVAETGQEIGPTNQQNAVVASTSSQSGSSASSSSSQSG